MEVALQGPEIYETFKWSKTNAVWEWVPFLYDSVVETIRLYVCFAGCKVQFIVVTSSSFVEAWYEKVMQTSIY